jgi:L-threonylcarbamoyladenylate synthase
VPNPASRFRWLAGSNPQAIGIRVPDLPAEARGFLERVGCVAATSANLHGGPDPARVEDIPDELVDAAAAIVDVGPLPGTASTVVDLTGLEPQILREGAVAAEEALATIARVATE